MDYFAGFIIQFDKKYNKLVKCNVALPKAVRAYFLLNEANMTEENDKLARIHRVLDSKHMKETGDPWGNKGIKNLETLSIKEGFYNRKLPHLSQRGVKKRFRRSTEKHK